MHYNSKIRVHPFVLRTKPWYLIWNMDLVANKFHLYFDNWTVINVLKLQNEKWYWTKIMLFVNFDFLNTCILWCCFRKMYLDKVRSIPICFVSKYTSSNAGGKISWFYMYFIMLELSVSYRNISCFHLILNVSISHIVSICAYVLGTTRVQELQWIILCPIKSSFYTGNQQKKAPTV